MKYFIAIAGLLLFTACHQEKTAYVNTETLVDGYYAMKSFQDSLQQKQKDLQQKYDRQIQELQKEFKEFQKNARRMSPSKANKKNQEINGKYQQIQQMQQMESYQLQQQSQKRATALIKEVTDFVKNYGKDNGYTYIFGTSDNNPTVVFGKEANDLTDELLVKLNAGHTDTAKDESNKNGEEKDKDSIK